MEKSDIAVETFKKGFNCAQAVFSTYSKEFGIDENTAKKISTAFGGGIVMQQQTCGAVSGAFMLIGCKFFDASMPLESREKVNEKCRLFIEAFKKRHKFISCRALVDFDFSNKEAMEKARKENLFHKICPDFIADACKILEKVLEEKELA